MNRRLLMLLMSFLVVMAVGAGLVIYHYATEPSAEAPSTAAMMLQMRPVPGGACAAARWSW